MNAFSKLQKPQHSKTLGSAGVAFHNVPQQLNE